MPAPMTPIHRAPSAGSAKASTPRSKASTYTVRQRLQQLRSRLQRLRSQPPALTTTLPRPADYDGLADVLDLIGAKVMTLALELRTVPDPATIEHTMAALQECYITLATAVEPDPRWSRA
jgi:hypothetical protein